jgi:hypothetical protein
MSSRGNTPLRTTIVAPSASETSRSLLDRLSLPESSIPTGNGLLRGTRQLMPPRTFSPTVRQNSVIMVDTSLNSLLASPTLSTHESSNTIEPFASVLHSDATSYSPTTPGLLTSTCSGSRTRVLEGLSQGIARGETAVEPAGANVEKLVEDGMKDAALTQSRAATTLTPVQNVTVMRTPPLSVSSRVPGIDRWAKRPRYVRDLVWADGELTQMTLAAWTENAPPLPPPPANELSNTTALKTIRDNPHLFKIVTPVDVDRLELLLRPHPNPPLVSSVCHGFRVGFWPWAVTEGVERPLLVDNSFWPLSDQSHTKFVHEQRDTEMALERFSPAFGPDLLPGMTSIPIGVVPKPHSNKLRLVVDQSSGDFSPNTLIPRDRVSVPLDNLHHLGASLINARLTHGTDVPLIVFKSDVSQAYRRLPLHFLWQLFQIITIDGMRHVDRNNNFGNRGAGGLWGAFMGLVLWIAIFVKGISDLFAYVDDSFSWEFADNMLWYEPFHLPAKQARLLQLWDELCIPHEESKQVFGSTLMIIGFDVDPNAMTITMPTEARLDLLTAIRGFARTGQRRPLRDFQRLAGWMNWALNVYPLLRPGMSSLYDKMSGKAHAHQPIWVSVALCRELLWFADRMENSDGIHIMSSREWGKNDADINLFCDACSLGLGFWFPAGNVGFQHALAPGTPSPGIFFYEAWTCDRVTGGFGGSDPI